LLENYCRAHPTTSFSYAALYLEGHLIKQLKAQLDQLSSDKKKEAIDPTTERHEEAPFRTFSFSAQR
jgi:hypothetical protein